MSLFNFYCAAVICRTMSRYVIIMSVRKRLHNTGSTIFNKAKKLKLALD